MDKNMINIDDLLKQRLADGEEKERPGAWLQMQELLDKEMPVTKVPVATFKWRRMFGYVAALLLVSAIGVGSYQLTSERNSQETYDGLVTNMPVEGSTIKNNDNATVNSDNNTPGNKTSDNANNNTADNTLGDTSNPYRTKKKTGEHITANAANTHASRHNNTTSEANRKNGAITKDGAKQSNNSIETVTGKQQDVKDKLLNSNRKNALVASIHSDNAKKSAVLTETTKNNKSQQNQQAAERQYNSGKAAVNTNKTASNINSQNNEPAKQVNADANATTKNNKSSQNQSPVTPASSKTGKKPGNGNVNPDYLVSKQVVPTIEVRQTYDRKEGWKSDTSKGQTEMEILVPAEKTQSDNTTEKQSNNIARVSEPSIPAKPKRPLITVIEETENNTAMVVPASGITLNTEAATNANNEKLLPLSSFRVSSKQSANYTRTNLIEQMVQNAKVNIGNAKFYGGIIGGVNTSLSGSNSMSGFQLGLTGTLSLNERWGIVSELKYLHRFNNTALKNNGYANLNEGLINGITTYTWDSVNRAFKFPTVSAMELPVYIRYSLNRLNFHAGMNLVYNFTINNIDIDSFGIHKTSTEGPVVKGAVNYSFNNGVPRIALEDFASRFSMGYLFGVGYQFTPAIQLDVRMSQSFWDNAKTDGAKEVSKKIYDVPSVQVNMSYRFGNNKFKPYHKN